MRLLTQRQPAPDRQLHVIGDGTNSLLQDDWRPALIILGLLVAAVVHLMLRLRDIVARAEQTKAFVAHLHTRVNEQATQIQDLTADAAQAAKEREAHLAQQATQIQDLTADAAQAAKEREAHLARIVELVEARAVQAKAESQASIRAEEALRTEIEERSTACMEAAAEALEGQYKKTQALLMPKVTGHTAAEAKAAGLTAMQAKAAGYTLQELKVGYALQEIKEAGCLEGLKAAGYRAAALRQAGYSCGEARHVGFTPFECRGAGYTYAEAKASGYQYGLESWGGRDFHIRPQINTWAGPSPPPAPQIMTPTRLPVTTPTATPTRSIR